LRPDDWAWLFLRMNKDYRSAYVYAKHQDDTENQNIARHLENQQDIQNIRTDSDGICAKHFGLCAWLNPAVDRLPVLKYDGSWFFPLKRLISEDPLRTEVSDKPYRHSKHPFSNDADAHPRLLANESLFGYHARGKVTYPEARDAFYEATKGSMISVAIDCGVPPDGQIAALKALAEITQTHLRIHGQKTHHHESA